MPEGAHHATRGRALALAVQILLGAHALLTVVLTISLQVADDPSLADPDPIIHAILNPESFVRATYALEVAEVSLGLQILASIVCGVCFLCWLHRSYGNLSQLNAPGSEVVGWFIPGYNLAHGYLSMRRLYLSLHARAFIVAWWWCFCLLTLGIAGASVARRFDGSRLRWAVAASDVAAAVLCAIVVRRIDRRQRERAGSA